MPRIILQPTGKHTKHDFIQGKWNSWAEQAKYVHIWEDSIGDYVLFIKDNSIFLIANIENIEIEEDNESYPLRYYFNNLQYVNIPLSDFNEVIGYANNFIPRNYMLVKEDYNSKALEFLNNYISKVYKETEDLLYQEDIQKSSIESDNLENYMPIMKGNLLEKNGSTYHPRNIKYAKQALYNANFLCEIDKNHTTFKSKTSGKNYVEAHHLIPLENYNDFDFSLDVPANIVSLCPNCHRLIHLGNNDDVNKALEILYTKRKKNLDQAGISVTLDELQYIYQTNKV